MAVSSVTPAIPANQLVAVNPSVLGPGGNALDLNGVMLTQNTRIPIGQVQQFATATDVSNFFGATSNEAALGAIYFNGFDGSHRKPANLMMAQYNIAPVSAYMRGGNVSGLSLTALQALNGTLSITIDSVVKSGTVNLSGATSFSNAAQIIGDTLNIPTLPEVAVVSGSITTTVLTVNSVQSGTLAVGDLITGTGVTAGTYITSLGTGTGGTGTYNVNNSQTVTATTLTATQPAAIVTGSIATTVLTVTAVAAGALAVGQIISGSTVTAGTYITSLGTGTGGTGTYNLSASQTVSSTTITAESPGVTFDSVSGAFIVTSASQGVGSTMSYGTGTIAASLGLTQAAGAVLSQGAAANTPNTGAPLAYMPTITSLTQNWAGFMTVWEPTDLDKESFATWNNNQNNRYEYVMWGTNILDTQSNGPSPPVAFVNNGNLSGIVKIYENPLVDTVGGFLAAFTLGYNASLDFTQLNGRATLAFRGQSGLQPQITNASTALQLLAYGIDFYGNYTTANQQFNLFQNGSISGPFKWADSYANQIWLNNQLQLSLMQLLQQAYSVPYNNYGFALIRAAVADPIAAAVNFGAIRAGLNLSALQAAQVNAAAGVAIDQILTQQGWYFQVLQPSAQVRAARQSPPCTLWYTDGQSVQQINLASIELL